jgi:hypothetical protein
MSTISGLGGADRSWQSMQSRKAEHEARMFAKVDSDGSGGVDATELASMLEHTGQSGDSAELLKKMDGNGDGSLSQDELSQGMRDLMPPPSSTLEFAQQRSAANDEVDVFTELDTDGDGSLTRAEFEAGRPAPPPGGMPPPGAAGGASSTAATSTDYDPLDVNQDGTVSQIERLAGQLKELAAADTDDASQSSGASEIAQLAQKLYDQIAKNWLQVSDTTSTQVSTSA